MIFTINDNLTVVCEWKKTRMAFKHTASLLRNGLEVVSTKICYQNRTWERYEFESVLEKLLRNAIMLTREEKELFANKIKNEFRADDEKKTKSMFNTVGMVMQMGEVLAGDTKKEKNDWKARMLKAGLESKGLIMPDDWNELDEDTKEARLNNLIKELAK